MRINFTDMAYGGDAVGRDPESGIAVFGWPAIEGEEADLDLVFRRKNLVRGNVSNLLRAAQDRVQAPCPYYGTCGGCQWQHIAYEAQLAFKSRILQNQLSRGAGIEIAGDLILEPLGSPQTFGYRNTSQFAIDPSKKSLAYFARETRGLLTIDACPISNSGINSLIARLNALFPTLASGDELRDEERGVMRIWKVGIRSSEATGQNIVILFTRAGGEARLLPTARGTTRHITRQRPEDGPSSEASPIGHPDFSVRRKDFRRAFGTMVVGDDRDLAIELVEIMDDGTVNYLGESRRSGALQSEVIADSISGSLLTGKNAAERLGPPRGAWVESLVSRNFWVAPDAFFQVNTPAAELLLAEVERHLPRRIGLLIDAHAGVGTFGVAFAGRADRVTGFETDRAAVASARWTAQANGAENFTIEEGTAEALFAALPDEEKPDCIILDPPRAGCHPKLLNEIIKRRPSRVIYVSCDPSTLARDTKVLMPAYGLSEARVVDMFPQTFHIETVAAYDLVG